MKKKIYCLGIIGTGRIAHRFVPEARTVDGVEITAVYNPRLSSAEKFATEHNIGFYTDDIESFIKEVDAVYIAAPHENHVDYCKYMLLNKKHVLCEKPMAFSKDEINELAVLAERQGCILMEALKTAYCPGFIALLDVIKSGKIGEVIDVEACFTKLVPESSRELTSEIYAGSFMELGSYVLLPILKILGENPKKINFWSKYNDNNVDLYTKVYFDYGGAIATGKVGLGVKSEGELIISGTKGYIRVPAPWWLTRKIEVHYEDANATDYYEYSFEKDGLRYEIKAFLDRINQENRDTGVTLEESAQIAEIMGCFLYERKRS